MRSTPVSLCRGAQQDQNYHCNQVLQELKPCSGTCSANLMTDEGDYRFLLSAKADCLSCTQYWVHQQTLWPASARLLGHGGTQFDSAIHLTLGSGDEGEGRHDWWLHLPLLQGLVESGPWWVQIPADPGWTDSSDATVVALSQG